MVDQVCRGKQEEHAGNDAKNCKSSAIEDAEEGDAHGSKGAITMLYGDSSHVVEHKVPDLLD